MKNKELTQEDKISQITLILKRMRDIELIDDLHAQLISAYTLFLKMQNKEIDTMMYDVENFFEGMEDDLALNERIQKPIGPRSKP